MIKTFYSPNKYVQGKDAIFDLPKYINILGKKPLVVITKTCKTRLQNTLNNCFDNTNLKIIFENFNGQSSRQEINRLIEIAKINNCDVIIGIGGGKLLDTTKAIAYYIKKPNICVPTIASSDAPCSAISMIYTNEGVVEEILTLDTNPDLVLVDSEIISKAPTRFLVSGMGDALATYYEARACINSNSRNCCNGYSTQASYALAELSFKLLFENGLKAKKDSDNNLVTENLEKVIEANTLLSGLGFESSGIAAAHSIHNGCSVIPECDKYYHGEKVAFGIIVQLVLENSENELNTVLEFLNSVGLPVCLEDIGIKNITKENIMKVAKRAYINTETIHNMPCEINVKKIYEAILTANSLGLASKNINKA